MCDDIDSSLQNLLIWVREFEYAEDSLKSSDLSDGVIISKILSDVSPIFFSIAWQSQINCEAAHFLSDKTFNLNHILGGISQFFIKVIGQQLEVFHLPDVALIVEKNDAEELFRLLQLVICCAVNGEHKERYIEAILSMEQSVQHAIMEAIQNVMSDRKTHTNSLADQTEEDLRQHCRQLEAKIAELEVKERREGVGKAVDVEDETPEDGNASSEPGLLSAQLRIRQLQQKIVGLNEELFHAETDNQETKLKLTEAQVKIGELTKTVSSLSVRADEASRMKDELDECREALQTANVLAASVEQWKRRAEEANALRLRCNKLELDNTAALKRLEELEQENRLQSSLRSTAEANKHQSVEAISRATSLQTRVEQAEAELKRVQVELQTSIHEKEVLRSEFNRLREQSDQSMFAAEEDSMKGMATPLHSLDTSLDDASRLLQHPSSPLLPSTVAESSALVGQLGGDERTDEEIHNTEGKTADVFEVEQRYRGYLAKALQLIRQLDQKLATAGTSAGTSTVDQSLQQNSEIVRLQTLLVEKENIIEKLEQHHEEARRQRDLEERLVLTAWYHLGMRVNRAGAEARLRGVGGVLGSDGTSGDGDLSFLARQRQLHLQSTPPPSSRVRDLG